MVKGDPKAALTGDVISLRFATVAVPERHNKKTSITAFSYRHCRYSDKSPDTPSPRVGGCHASGSRLLAFKITEEHAKLVARAVYFWSCIKN
jgi:hypothetical protein